MNSKSHSKLASDLYNERFGLFGRDLRTVGWGSQADQILRFDVLFRGIDPKGKTILDVGCGLGDLIPYLEHRTGSDFRYIGLDVADRLIDDARKVHRNDRYTFLHGDLLSVKLPEIDISVMSGALSLRSDGIVEYAKQTMDEMFVISREAACLNFLSKYVDYELEKNQHYQPEQVFSWARTIASKVNLYHDYPLFEFTVQLLRTEAIGP
jgi:ubiquinone/menaquinone biosynthesis C-methylase UbiE